MYKIAMYLMLHLIQAKGCLLCQTVLECVLFMDHGPPGSTKLYLNIGHQGKEERVLPLCDTDPPILIILLILLSHACYSPKAHMRLSKLISVSVSLYGSQG